MILQLDWKFVLRRRNDGTGNEEIKVTEQEQCVTRQSGNGLTTTKVQAK